MVLTAVLMVVLGVGETVRLWSVGKEGMDDS